MSYCPFCGAHTYLDMESPCASVELWECGTRWDTVVGCGYMQSKECKRRVEGDFEMELEEKVLKLARKYENMNTKEAILAELLISTVDAYQQLIVSCEKATSFQNSAWTRARQRLEAWFGLGPSPPPPGTD